MFADWLESNRVFRVNIYICSLLLRLAYPSLTMRKDFFKEITLSNCMLNKKKLFVVYGFLM